MHMSGTRYQQVNDQKTVWGLVNAQASERPDKTYLVADESGRHLSFGELRASCCRMSSFFEQQGVALGDRVAVVMPNCFAAAQLLVGTMYSGRCVLPVNLLSGREQLRFVLEHSDCKLIFAGREWTGRLRDSLPADSGKRIVEIDGESLVLPGQRETTPCEPRSEALALLMYTSGTTGIPKGVMLTQGNVAANAYAIGREHALEATDRVAGVLPLYHINGFMVTMLSPLAYGGSVALASRFSAGRFWGLVEEHGCTWLNVVPTIISYLLETEAPSKETLSRVRFCRSASAALPPRHYSEFQSRFGIGIIETMGLTESAAPAFSNPLSERKRRPGSVGRPAGCEARVVDEAGNTLPDGERGEIVLRGPQLTSGYYRNPEATKAAFFPGGWFRTGDLGCRDRDGFFYITGRIKELIIKGGENIAPREIDETLLQHPLIADAACVGIPDRHYGQEIMACVVIREKKEHGSVDHESLREDLRRFCAEHVGPYKTPKMIRFVEELPRGPSGKVQRLKLLDAKEESSVAP